MPCFRAATASAPAAESQWYAEPKRLARLGHLAASTEPGLREELVEITARLDAAREVAAGLPHRERYLLLNNRLAQRIVDAHADWLDEIERELG